MPAEAVTFFNREYNCKMNQLISDAHGIRLISALYDGLPDRLQTGKIYLSSRAVYFENHE
jgi:hypothetical protein